MTTKCANCGEPLSSDDKLCPNCGAALGEMWPPPPSSRGDELPGPARSLPPWLQCLIGVFIVFALSTGLALVAREAKLFSVYAVGVGLLLLVAIIAVRNSPGFKKNSVAVAALFLGGSLVVFWNGLITCYGIFRHR
ncbi:MAG TPA: zinc ribbon domain-containing protein [Capsulimonadaceae bacterium]|jgi:hypothetical protein